LAIGGFDIVGMQALIDEYHLLAADVVSRHGAQFLRNDEARTRYDGNHVRCIREVRDVDSLFDAIESHYAHLPYRAVRVDPFTPPATEARLLLEDYLHDTEIVLAAAGQLGGRPADIEIRTVSCDSVELEQVIAREAEFASLDEWLAASAERREEWTLIQRRGDSFTWYVAFDDGKPVGHFSQRTRGELGYLESLFVDPDYRMRGIGTALTHHTAAAARVEGARIVFLPAAADDTPKEMYRRMGFGAVYAFRNYRKDVPSQVNRPLPVAGRSPSLPDPRTAPPT
jgi:ribosomal protein S18 acetylase RimI-like enzyme